MRKMGRKYIKKSNKKTEITKIIEDTEKEIIDASGVERIKETVMRIPKDSEREK